MRKHEYIRSSEENHLNFYPRPTLKRSEDANYLNLNGIWDIDIKKSYIENIDIKNITFNKTINVPYPVESYASGIEYDLSGDEVLIYHKSFEYLSTKEKTILHIDGADNHTVVYLNGERVGENIGGYLPFSFDVSRLIRKTNDLIVIVSDNLDFNYPYGKQSKESHGIWYTKCSGIWKSVWLESVDSDAITKIKIDTDIDKKELKIDFFKEEKASIKIIFNDELIRKIDEYKSNEVIKFDSINLWSPEEPNLYDLVISYKDDSVKSYFAFRKISVVEHNGFKVFALNNKPYFMHGLLDQGYYPESLLAISSIETLENDLKKIKEYGFNTLRKHIKIEEEIWYYLCDKLGIIVWQDFVNSFKYNFFFDSALPTIGLKGKSLKIASYKREAKDFFINHSIETIEYLYNHPSIVLWTIFNEGWGQFETKKVYDLIKVHDETRIFDSASGWFNDHKEREIESKHIYFKPIKIKKTYDKPLVISEFGGYALKIDNHTYYDKAFGYKVFNTQDEYNKALFDLYKNDIYENIKKGVCASIYTQVSDVEEEINGIMTYDRKVMKLDKEVAIKISKMLKL